MNKPLNDAASLLYEATQYKYFIPNDAGVTPIPYRFVPGAPGGKLGLVLGENASGKSFVRRLCSAIYAQQTPKIELLAPSMEHRTTGYMASVFYGSENYDSTGQNSSRTILTGFRTARSRDESGSPHALFFDEPDIGLSDLWAASAGVALRDFVKAGVPKMTQAVIVVTHSRALVRKLAPLDPTVLFVGDVLPENLASWLKPPRRKIPKLEELSERSLERYRLVSACLKAAKEKRESDGSKSSG